MSDYGLRVRDSGGSVILDIDEQITRFRYSNEVSSGSSGNTTLSDISGLLSVEFSLMLVTSYGACPHVVSRSGTTITWTATSSPDYSSADSIVFLFLYS